MPDRHDTALTAAAWAMFALCLAIAAAPAVSGPFPSAGRGQAARQACAPVRPSALSFEVRPCGLPILEAGLTSTVADRDAEAPASFPRQDGQP